MKRAAAAQVGVHSMADRRHAVAHEPRLGNTSVAHAVDMTRKQTTMFAKLDKFDFDDTSLYASAADNNRQDAWSLRLSVSVAALPNELRHAPVSHTVVLEAVSFLVRSGVLNVKGTSKANIKQARALLAFGLWLQSRMSREWVADGKLAAPSWRFEDYTLAHILIGGAGTGKTSALRVMEALLNYFCGPESMNKGAPTNTAARLLRGNTLHALHKLPSKGTILGRRAHLSGRVLKAYRRSWASKHAQAIDEISMVPPELLYRLQVRTQQGKQSERFMGDVGTILSGDFLQIPPVLSRSLAMPMDAKGFPVR